MTTISRTLILAGFVAVTGASSAFAGAHPRDVAWKEYIQKAPPAQEENAPLMHEGRSATMFAPATHERCDLFHREGCYYRR
jgi:hypothetical protein